MKRKSAVTFTIDQLTKFLKKYPIQSVDDNLYIEQDETDIYLVAFKYYVEHGKDIMDDYYKIKNALNYFYNIDEYKIHFANGCLPQNFLQDIKENFEFILNYNGALNINWILNKFNCGRIALEKCLYEIENDFPEYNETSNLEKKETQEKYISNYYEVQRTLTKEDLDTFFAKTLKEEMSSTIDKNLIDVTNVKYPILIFFYKNDKIISINKITKNLESSLVNHKKSKDFDSYSYIFIDENIIDDIFAEALLRYNPSNMIANAITFKNSVYRTLGQIKQRYKDNTRVDLRIIKKVISLYKIPIYNLKNGQEIIDKDLFDEALNKYLNGK